MEKQDRTCKSCASSEFISGGQCKACTVCPSNQVENTACGTNSVRHCTPTMSAHVTLQDRTCKSCSTGQYVNSGTCTACASCPAGQFRNNCGGSSAGTCTNCPVNQFKTGSGTGGCSICAGCQAGFERIGCGGSSAGSCQGTIQSQITVAHPARHHVPNP